MLKKEKERKEHQKHKSNTDVNNYKNEILQLVKTGEF